MPKINIFCKASVIEGLGHLIRQIHIARELRKQNADIFFYIPGFSTAEDILKKHNFSYQAVEDFCSASTTKTDKSDTTILDIHDTSSSLIQNLKKRSKKIISFEDHGEGRNQVDLLIDCNLIPEDSKSVTSNTRPLFGLPYSVLAPEFENFHLENRSFSEKIQSLLITFGGTDPNNITLDLARRIPSEIKTTAIAGPGFQNMNALQEINTSHICIVQNVQNMASMLFNHDAVFCSGGVTLHEAMCVGTPAFVISQVEHQEEKARSVENLGAAINLGKANTWDKNRLPEVFNLGKNDLQKMSTAGKSQIDGKGLKRIVEAIL
ncbi:MAG: hypothetical protein F3743_07890 [Nitrospinae bacterium]|nr:hypothetical protein [Nitrospinota bacterium]